MNNSFWYETTSSSSSSSRDTNNDDNHSSSSSSSSSLGWADTTAHSLQINTWTAPLFIDGRDWNAHKSVAAKRLLECLAGNTSCLSLVLQNAILNSSHALERALSQKSQSFTSLTLRNVSSLQAEMLDTLYPLPLSALLPSLLENKDTTNSQNASTKLTSLTLIQCRLDDRGCQALSQILLQQDCRIQSLTLNAIQMTCPELVLFAVAACQTLEVVQLADITVNSNIVPANKDKNVWKDFLNILAYKNTRITDLSLEGCRLNVEHAPALAKMLQTNTTLTQLSLQRNQLDAVALNVLVSQGLVNNLSLQNLWLSHNPLTTAGAGALVLNQYLSSCSCRNLRELRLVGCGFAPGCCQLILQGLQSNTTLQYLHLNDNPGLQAADLVHLLEHYNFTLHSVVERLVLAHMMNNSTINDDSSSLSSSDLWKMVDFWLAANRGGRRILRLNDGNNNNIHHAQQLFLLPHIFANSASTDKASVLFHLLSNTTARWQPTTGMETTTTRRGNGNEQRTMATTAKPLFLMSSLLLKKEVTSSCAGTSPSAALALKSRKQSQPRRLFPPSA